MDAPTSIFAKYLLVWAVLVAALIGVHALAPLPEWVRHVEPVAFLLLMLVAVKDAYLAGFLRGRDDGKK